MDSSVSDHKATYIVLSSSLKYNRSYKRKVWIYKDADFDKLNSLIQHCDWTNIITKADNVNIAVDNFTIKFLSFVRECIPEQTKTIRPRDKPWFDSVLRRTIRVRDRLRKKAIETIKDYVWSAHRKVHLHCYFTDHLLIILFHVFGKLLTLFLYSKKMIRHWFLIIDRYLCDHVLVEL